MLSSLACSISPWCSFRRSLLRVKGDLFARFFFLLLYLPYLQQDVPQSYKGPPLSPIITTEGKRHKNLPKGLKQGRRWQAILEKRKIIWSKSIKTSYNQFHSPLPIRTSTNQLVLGGYLPILISHEPHNFSHYNIF